MRTHRSYGHVAVKAMRRRLRWGCQPTEKESSNGHMLAHSEMLLHLRWHSLSLQRLIVITYSLLHRPSSHARCPSV